ncbi:MAG: hypothetical protein CVV49_10300 [Spirochaetae bacterium HGW-Spirochaetae-5]|nr:MAG: hypothetical protein CVV49_10300 [Spirochaetae bacterium HGW-Spirochaetae-5]
MKRILIIFIILVSMPAVFLSAEGDEKTPGMSIGINANFGSFDLHQKNMDLDVRPGIYTGGGISIEKQIYGIFNAGSGVQYRYFNTDFIMNDQIPEFESTWTMQSINIPFLLILSFSGGESALNLIGGVVYSHVFYSVMKTDANVPLAKHNDDVQRFTNSNQIGLTGGIIFKIKSTKYTDFLFGVMGEYYPTNLLSDSGDKLHMINYSFTTGYMFRTNIFPGSK